MTQENEPKIQTAIIQITDFPITITTNKINSNIMSNSNRNNNQEDESPDGLDEDPNKSNTYSQGRLTNLQSTTITSKVKMNWNNNFSKDKDLKVLESKDKDKDNKEKEKEKDQKEPKESTPTLLKDKKGVGKQIPYNSSFNQTNIYNNPYAQTTSKPPKETKGKEEPTSLLSKLQEEVESVEIDPSFKHKLNITLNNLNDSSIQDTSAKVCILLSGEGIKYVKDKDPKQLQEELLSYFVQYFVVMRIVKETNYQNVQEKMVSNMSEKVETLQEVLLDQL